MKSKSQRFLFFLIIVNVLEKISQKRMISLATFPNEKKILPQAISGFEEIHPF